MYPTHYICLHQGLVLSLYLFVVIDGLTKIIQDDVWSMLFADVIF